MDPIPPRDPLDPHPREGGRGKGKPSQLEDWKSLKPKPPQPRGLVGFTKTSPLFSGGFRPLLELLGQDGHVHVPTFGSISHVSVSKLKF